MMRNKEKVTSSLQLILQLHKLATKNKDSGYALILASLISILLFGMLSAYLFSNKMYKASADATIDASSTFYAAEFGLNKRADTVRKKFDAYSSPTGDTPGNAGDSISVQMANCLSGASTAKKGTGDFACRVDETNYKEAYTAYNSSAAGGYGGSNGYRETPSVKYRSFSFVRPVTTSTELTTISSGSFSGLKAQENRYRVYSTAIKQIGTNDGSIGAQAMLQMEFVSHYIPVFQFAAFYEKDLEMTNSGLMNITGPVHTNASLYLAPGGLLVLNNRSTYVNTAYRSLSYTANHGSTTDGRRVMMAGGGPYSVNNPTATTGYPVLDALDVLPAWSNPNLSISDADITASKGMLKKISKLKLPEVGFLKQNGDFFDKADVRVLFNPSGPATVAVPATATLPAIPATPVPFNVISINRGAGTSLDFNTRPGLISSLQKPVLLRIDSFTADRQLSAATRLCPNLVNNGLGEPTSLSEAIPSVSATILPLLPTTQSRQRVITALQEAIAKSPITYSATKGTSASVGGSFNANFINAMKTAVPATGLPALSTSTANTIAAQPLNAIAALNVNSVGTNLATSGNGGCFLPAPMQVVTGNDRKENFSSSPAGRAMTILQSNIKSLTAWNRDGRYWDTAALSMNRTANLLFTRNDTTTIATTAVTALTNNKATGQCDLECLGLAPIDTTEGGLVWHYSLVNRTTAPYNYPSGDGYTRSDTEGTSSFGFAFSGGNRLPGPLTIASDQAIYLQGDYNNPSNIPGDKGSNPNAAGELDLDQSRFSDLNPNSGTNIPPAREKRPASFLGDSMTILSNNCYDSNYTVQACLTPSNTALQVAGTSTVKATVVRAAILSGTESTVLNAGGGLSERGAALNNHIRMLENWYTPVTGGLPDKTFKYRGSFVSKGLQTEFNGQYRGGSGAGFGADYYGIPNRDFGFDKDFNRIDGLPPLTPRVTYLTQQVFKRDYDSNNR
jgi:hypothetical protein